METSAVFWKPQLILKNRKKKKVVRTGKNEIKPQLFTFDMTEYITQKILETLQTTKLVNLVWSI